MSPKDKVINDEKGLVGKIVTVTCVDRAESEFTNCELKAINNAGVLLAWESRGVFNITHIPLRNVGYISARYGNTTTPTNDQKPA